jgi:hypothetical protein
MKTRKEFALASLVIALTVGISGIAYSSDSAPATVGQFIKSLAVETRAQPSTPKDSSGTSPRAAAAWADLNANSTLTYGTVYRIAADLGVQVAPPANPNAVVSSAQAGVIAGQISASRGVTGVAVPADDLPSQCLSSDNRGKCVDCCKQASGEGGQFCGRFCHNNVPPPPSPGEPTP